MVTMPPVPMYPDNPIADSGGLHRLWMWGDHEIDLDPRLDGDAYPVPVRAAVLAHRDADPDDPDDLDAAALLVWTVEEHPPWSGGCSTCGTAAECDAQQAARDVALLYMIRKTTTIVRRSRVTVARFDQKRATT
jgi:hypothetical protein